MKLTKNKFQKIERIAKANTESDGKPHDFNHIKRVFKVALYLAKKEGADQNIVKVAALLHDIAHKRCGSQNHERKSAEMAKKILAGIGFNQKDINKIAHAIECHGSSEIHKAKTMEAKIIFDADKSQTTSLYGFFRVLNEYLVIQKMDINQTLEKLEKVLDKHYHLLNTKTAKDLVKKDREFIKKIFRLYNKEKTI